MGLVPDPTHDPGGSGTSRPPVGLGALLEGPSSSACGSLHFLGLEDGNEKPRSSKNSSDGAAKKGPRRGDPELGKKLALVLGDEASLSGSTACLEAFRQALSRRVSQISDVEGSAGCEEAEEDEEEPEGEDDGAGGGRLGPDRVSISTSRWAWRSGPWI